MGFSGKTLLPREVAAAAAKQWAGVELVKATATFLGESRGSVGAWHDNVGPDELDNELLSRDCGLAQISILAVHIGGPEEARLRTESLDPAVFGPVVAYNVGRARALYDQSWTRDGVKDIRRWQPWRAYTSGWATYPGWWVWARPWLDHWAATGRYIQQAVAGVANWHLLIKGDLSPQEALSLARTYQATFRVEGTLAVREKGVYWAVKPARPTVPPEDGVGPRPAENDGK